MANEYSRPITAFIPKPLEIEGRPELNKFPKNILFLCGFNADLFARYIPVLQTYRESIDYAGMIYVNSQDIRGLVAIEYSPNKSQWQGKKTFDNENVGSAFGNNWQGFFIHLTFLGADRRERLGSIFDQYILNDNM